MSKESYANQIKQSLNEIVEQLEKDNKIILQTTPNGLKIQSMKVKTINNKGGN